MRNAHEKSRWWFCTWNDEAFVDPEIGESCFEEIGEHAMVRGVTGQLEQGENGNRHLQLVVRLENAFTLRWLKENVNEYAHWERCMDTRGAIAYVTKEDTRVAGPWTVGDVERRPGQRTDLERLQSDIREGMSLQEISEEYFGLWIRYPRGITAYILQHQTPREYVMEVHVLWGRTGTGKTRAVYERARGDDFSVYPLSQNYSGGVIWWDNYQGEEIVLIDDFYGWIPISYLLKLLDRYPMMVRTREGHQQFVSKVLYITSNQDPREWYPNAPEEVRAALRRRFTRVTHFETPFQ